MSTVARFAFFLGTDQIDPQDYYRARINRANETFRALYKEEYTLIPEQITRFGFDCAGKKGSKDWSQEILRFETICNEAVGNLSKIRTAYEDAIAYLTPPPKLGCEDLKILVKLELNVAAIEALYIERFVKNVESMQAQVAKINNLLEQIEGAYESLKIIC